MSKIAIHNKKNDRTILTNKLTYPELVNESLAEAIGAGRYKGFAPTTVSKSGNTHIIECIVDGYTPIKQLFHRAKISRKVFLDLVYQIGEMIRECERTKISPNNMDLRMETIFMKANTHEIVCVYWPIVNMSENVPPQTFLQNLPLAITSDPDEGNHYIEQYLDFFKHCKPYSNDAFLAFICKLNGMRFGGDSQANSMSVPGGGMPRTNTYSGNVSSPAGVNIEYNPINAMREQRVAENMKQQSNSVGNNNWGNNSFGGNSLSGNSGNSNIVGNRMGAADAISDKEWDSTVGVFDTNLFKNKPVTGFDERASKNPGSFDSMQNASIGYNPMANARPVTQPIVNESVKNQDLGETVAVFNSRGMANNTAGQNNNVQRASNVSIPNPNRLQPRDGGSKPQAAPGAMNWDLYVNLDDTPRAANSQNGFGSQQQTNTQNGFGSPKAMNSGSSANMQNSMNSQWSANVQQNSQWSAGSQQNSMNSQWSANNKPTNSLSGFGNQQSSLNSFGGDFGEATVSIAAGFSGGASQQIKKSAGARLIRVKTGDGFEINKSMTIIGNGKESADIAVDNKFISRKHACVIQKNNRYYLMDMKSTNKTYLEGVAVQPSEEKELVNGSKIKLANEEFVFFVI